MDKLLSGHFSEQNFRKRLSTTFSSLEEHPEKKTGIYLIIKVLFLNTFDFSYVDFIDDTVAKGDTKVEGSSNASEDKKKKNLHRKS